MCRQDLSSEFDPNRASANDHDAVGRLDAIRVRLPQSGTQLCCHGVKNSPFEQHKCAAALARLPQTQSVSCATFKHRRAITENRAWQQHTEFKRSNSC